MVAVAIQAGNNAKITLHKGGNGFDYLGIECDDPEIMACIKAILPKPPVLPTRLPDGQVEAKRVRTPVEQR